MSCIHYTLINMHNFFTGSFNDLLKHDLNCANLDLMTVSSDFSISDFEGEPMGKTGETKSLSNIFYT